MVYIVKFDSYDNIPPRVSFYPPLCFIYCYYLCTCAKNEPLKIVFSTFTIFLDWTEEICCWSSSNTCGSVVMMFHDIPAVKFGHDSLKIVILMSTWHWHCQVESTSSSNNELQTVMDTKFRKWWKIVSLILTYTIFSQ